MSRSWRRSRSRKVRPHRAAAAYLFFLAYRYNLDLHSFPTRRSSDLTNINIIARRTGKDVNSHTVLDGIITTIMATIQRINIIGSREGSRNRRRLKANQTGKKFRVALSLLRSEERFSRNAETDLVCRL